MGERTYKQLNWTSRIKLETMLKHGHSKKEIAEELGVHISTVYGEWGQFDRYCKLVLYHEAIDYLREMKCRRDREVSLDALSPADWDKLSTVDRYSCDSFTFSSHGYDLHIDNELVAEAFASLPKDEQSILILRFVLDLTDEEIGRLMGMSRSAVQRHRTSTLKDLRVKLMAFMPEGG